MALLISVFKMFMRCHRWNIRRQRTREMQIGSPTERPIINPSHVLDIEL